MPKPLISITRTHAFLFAGFLVAYEFLTYIANDMIMPGMVQVVELFKAPESAIASSLTAYMLGGASLQIILGPLSDRFGRRPVMLAGAVLFFLFTFLIACSQSINQFLIARFFEGMGLCFICVVGYATLQEIFEEMDAIRLTALMANVSILSPLLGPLLGVLCVYYFSWRAIFIVVSILALITLWGLWKYMPESVGQKRLDGEIIPRIELSYKNILSNYKVLLCNPKFMLASLSLSFLGLPCIAWIGLSPVILVTEGHLSLLDYGLWQLPIFGAIIVGNLILHRWTHRYSIERLILIGVTTSVVGLLFTFILPLLGGQYFLYLLPGLTIYSLGLGIAGSPLSRFILFSTPIAKGTASAMMSMILMGLQAVGMEVVNRLYIYHNNVIFGAYCAIVGVACGLVLWGAQRTGG